MIEDTFIESNAAMLSPWLMCSPYPKSCRIATIADGVHAPVQIIMMKNSFIANFNSIYELKNQIKIQ